MKRGTTAKLKFLQLKAELGLPLWQAIGLLQALWDLVTVNAPAGDIGRFSNEEIAQGIEWIGDPEELIAALVKCRWLDEHETARLVVHDWSEHAEDSVHNMLARRHERFADDRVPSLKRLSTREREGIEKAFAAQPAFDDPCARRAHKSTQKRSPCAQPSLALARPKPSLAKPSLAKPSLMPTDAPAKAGLNELEGLSALVKAWNELPEGIVGHKAKSEPIGTELVEAYRAAIKSQPLRNALDDVPRLMAAIQRARYCHKQSWFDLAWLFTRKNKRYRACMILEGIYDNAPDQPTNGRGHSVGHDRAGRSPASPGQFDIRPIETSPDGLTTATSNGAAHRAP